MEPEAKERVPTNELGTILGLPGPAWAVFCLILVTVIVFVSVYAIGDLNF